MHVGYRHILSVSTGLPSVVFVSIRKCRRLEDARHVVDIELVSDDHLGGEVRAVRFPSVMESMP